MHTHVFEGELRIPQRERRFVHHAFGRPAYSAATGNCISTAMMEVREKGKGVWRWCGKRGTELRPRDTRGWGARGEITFIYAS